MAKQHIYARTQKGYFTKRSGFDTVALTNGLTEDFVTNFIHPFCFYHKPNFKDEYAGVFPTVYFGSEISAQDGKDKKSLIFGRNIYVHGNRNSMLSHSIIVYSEEEKIYAYKNFDSFIMFDRYMHNSYEDNDGRDAVLEEVNLKNVSYDNLYLMSQVLLEALQISKEKYEFLLYQTFHALENNTTIFIKLGCNRKICSEGARLLLRCLYLNIPEKIRSKLSYLSYTPVLEINCFFHLVFVDNAVDLERVPGSRQIIDFTKPIPFDKKFLFLDFAWNNLNFNNIAGLNCRHYLLQEKISFIEFEANIKNYLSDRKLFFENFNPCNERFKNNVSLYISILMQCIELWDYYPYDYEKWLNSVYDVKKKYFKKYTPSSTSQNIEYLLAKGFPNKGHFRLYSGLFFFSKDNYISEILHKLDSFTDLRGFLAFTWFYVIRSDLFLEKSNTSLFFDAVIQKANFFEEDMLSQKDILDSKSLLKKIIELYF